MNLNLTIAKTVYCMQVHISISFISMILFDNSISLKVKQLNMTIIFYET